MPAPRTPSGRRLQLIEYPDGEDLVDHKGRSKPIYKPSSPRPRQERGWRPGLYARLLLGAFPGLRLMVTKSVPAGLPYAILGLLAGLGALLVVLTWSVGATNIEQLNIQPRWILIRGVCVWTLVVVYELLRFGAALEEQGRGPVTPRLLSAMVLPALLIVVTAPAFMDGAPRLMESAWFAALVVGFGATPAAVACVIDLASPTPQLRTRVGVALVAVVIVAATLPILGVPIFDGLAEVSRAAGFRVLPRLLP